MKKRQDFKGKAVVVIFGYTHCPEVCTTTLETMREVLTRLGADASHVQVIFLTLDPARVTSQVLAAYVTALHHSFIGLRGDEAMTAAVAMEVMVFYAGQAGTTAGSYSNDQTTGSYAFGPQGRMRLLMSDGETPDRIAADLKLLIAGE